MHNKLDNETTAGRTHANKPGYETCDQNQLITWPTAHRATKAFNRTDTNYYKTRIHYWPSIIKSGSAVRKTNANSPLASAVPHQLHSYGNSLKFRFKYQSKSVVFWCVIVPTKAVVKVLGNEVRNKWTKRVKNVGIIENKLAIIKMRLLPTSWLWKCDEIRSMLRARPLKTLSFSPAQANAIRGNSNKNTITHKSLLYPTWNSP